MLSAASYCLWLLRGRVLRRIATVYDLPIGDRHGHFRGRQAAGGPRKDIVGEDDDVGQHVIGELSLAQLVE